MVYSILPLSNQAGSHVGFFFIVAILLVCLGSVFFNYLQTYWSLGNTIAMVFIAAFGSFSYYASYAPINNIPMVNEKVTAKFSGYVAEEKSHSCGKNSTCYSNLVYGRFETPDGSVLLEVDHKSPIPEYVILYKN